MWLEAHVSMARVATALLAVTLECAVLGAVTACGAPQYTYVKSTANRTYFKVPASWREIDDKALKPIMTGDSQAAGSDGVWAVAYDAAEDPSPAHLVSSDTSQPIVYASVQPVPQEARGQVSLDSLRDLVLPVTPAAREATTAAPATFTDFSLVKDAVLTPQPGIRGIHEVFQYRVRGGPLQTFDKTAYVNDDASKVYVLLLRCSTECYQARRAELESVAASFTVKEDS
jgi:hypothetical protein